MSLIARSDHRLPGSLYSVKIVLILRVDEGQFSNALIVENDLSSFVVLFSV